MNLKQNIIRIINEEVDKKAQSLLNYIQKFGLIKGSKLVGGYKNLKEILKGTEYLNYNIMLDTIKNYFEQPNTIQFLDLNNDLGLEHITLEKNNYHLMTLSGLFKKGFEYQIYEKDRDGDYDLTDDGVESFEDHNNRKEHLLKTIHLYEIVDAIMEILENENKR